MFLNNSSNKDNNISITFASWLLIVLPILLITGPLLSDLAISLIAIIFCYNCYIYKDYSLFKSTYFKIAFFFWIYLILNSLFNNPNLTSFKIAFFYIRFILFSLAICFLCLNNNDLLKHFFYFLIFCFCILIFDGYLQFFTNKNIIGYEVSNTGRISSFFGDELILGSYLSRLLPILFALSIYLKKKNYINFKIIILIFIFSDALVFLSGERTAFFYINLSAVFVIIFIKDFKKIRIFTLLASLFLIFIISSFNIKSKERIIDKTFEQFNYQKSVPIEKVDRVNGKINDRIFGIYVFSKQHTHHYISALRMFYDNKFFGVGIKNFRNFCSNKNYEVSHLSCSTHPHNSYIQVLSELGFVGFAFITSIFLIFIFSCTKHLVAFLRYKEFYLNDFQIALFSAILVTIWPFVPTGNFFNNWLNIIYYLPLGFFIFSKK